MSIWGGRFAVVQSSQGSMHNDVKVNCAILLMGCESNGAVIYQFNLVAVGMT